MNEDATPTRTEFEKEMRRVIEAAISTARGDSVHAPDDELAIEVALEKVKLAVDKHVIGGKLEPIDVGALTGPNIRRKNGKDAYASSRSLTGVQGAYLMAHNGLLAKQRQSLWGKKS